VSGGVLIAGGGTGGHLFPGLAVAGELARLRPGVEIAFVSAGKALESRVLARAGHPLEALPARAVVGAGLVARGQAFALLPRGVAGALGVLRRRRPALVLAVGGYAAFPLGVAARLAGVPLAVQEQNAIPGLTNRALSRLARAVYISFPQARQHLPAAKCRLTGNPVRAEVLAQAREAEARRGEGGRFTVLVVGGSQGAASLNRALMQALPRLAGLQGGLRFVHQTGPDMEREVREAYRERGFAARVGAFFERMGEAYGAADLVICRAGAGTVSELAAVGRASVLVPYPHAAGDHQTANARAMARAGAARLVPDAEMDGAAAAGVIAELESDRAGLAAMARAARGLGRPRAAAEIARDCLRLMEAA
jgi:UDP-N-acetylglucosamine--N-acetylmuramyl-(pentapeptide) pyrophosphoryl-undecaprenol N-acetylglucosamine transferase